MLADLGVITKHWHGPDRSKASHEGIARRDGETVPWSEASSGAQ